MDVVKHWLLEPTVVKILTAVVAVIVVRVVAGLVLRGLVRRIKDNTGRYHARKLVIFASYLVLALALTVIFSDRLGSLTVAFGVAGAGIAKRVARRMQTRSMTTMAWRPTSRSSNRKTPLRRPMPAKSRRQVRRAGMARKARAMSALARAADVAVAAVADGVIGSGRKTLAERVMTNPLGRPQPMALPMMVIPSSRWLRSLRLRANPI